MKKPYTPSILVKETLQLNIADLKKQKFLQPDNFSTQNLVWRNEGELIGRISIVVNTCESPQYIELDYKYMDERINYQIELVSIPSNLGKGVVWYFYCPKINKRCRKLYFIDGFFQHREAYNGCIYKSQVKSKNARLFDKVFGTFFKAEALEEQANQKYFRETYAGKPTKRYLHMMKQIKTAENVLLYDLDSF